jgi:protein-S-isoprenylcysteine O-methyltransferase Ste14
MLVGYTFTRWVLVENRFFSGVVRIQAERGYTVMSVGSYRWVRPPGYAGTLLFEPTTPFYFSSYWALLSMAVMTLIVVIRTQLEDKTLRAELPDYAEYAQSVRYRLLPGIW